MTFETKQTTFVEKQTTKQPASDCCAFVCRSPLAANQQVKEYVDACLTHAVRPICNIFQITGHNRARQRDKWGHLLEDLANLQDEVRLLSLISRRSVLQSGFARVAESLECCFFVGFFWFKYLSKVLEFNCVFLSFLESDEPRFVC